MGLLFSSLVVFFIVTYIVISEIGIIVPRFERIMDHLKFGIPTIPSNLSNWVVNASDRYVIGYYLGPSSVAYYSPGYSLGTIINDFSAPLNFILPATLSRYYDNNNIADVKNTLNYSLKYYLILAIPSFFGLSLLSKQLLTILTTPEIASNGYLITPLVALSSLLIGVYTIFQKIIVLEKKTKITANISFIAAIVNFLLNILIIPFVGIVGAAFTTLLAYIIYLILTLLYSCKFLTIDLNIKVILKSVFSSLGMSLFICTTRSYITEVSSLLITIFVCSIIYFTLLLLMEGIDKNEITILKSLVKI
jgi:O-antigen/teichoic acid export membrane protein